MPMKVLRIAEDWFTPPSEEAQKAADSHYVAAEFLIRPMSLAAQEAHQNCAGREEIPMGSMVMVALKAGLRGWRNVVDENGTEVKFVGEGTQKEPTDETLERLPLGVRMELWREIKNRSFLTEAQRKNSASLST